MNETNQAVEVVKYDLEEATVRELDKKYEDVKIIPDDKITYETVKRGIGEYRNLRVAAEKWRKEKKAYALAFGHMVDDEAKRVFALLAPGEERLKAIRKEEDDRIEAIEKERFDIIQTKINEIEGMGFSLSNSTVNDLKDKIHYLKNYEITDNDFQEFKGEAMSTVHNTLITLRQALKDREEEEKKAAERKAEEERLEKQRKEQEAENKRLEAERLKREEEERKIQEEKDKLEAEKRKIEEEKERQRVEQEAKEKAEKEAKEKIEQEEQERIRKEKEEVERKARQEALKPDKEKIHSYFMALKNLGIPDIKDSKLFEFVFTANEKIEELIDLKIIELEEL